MRLWQRLRSRWHEQRAGQDTALCRRWVGQYGQRHAEAIFGGKVPEATLGAVCDIAPERRAWAAEHLPGVPVYDTFDGLLAAGQADAVVLATPHYYHPPMAVAAFARGLHVLTEKPAGVQISAVQQMVPCRGAERPGVRHHV